MPSTCLLPQSTAGGRIPRMVVLLAVNGGLILLGLCALELIFGNWFLPYMPPLPAMLNQKTIYMQELYEPWSKVTYIRDKYGLRGLTRPISDVELVTVGGSTTDQKFISEGETWQDVIYSRTGIIIANAGVDGMAASGHIIAVEDWLHRIPGLHPKHFLHYVGLNDALLPSLGALQSWEHLARAESKRKPTWTRQLEARSAIWHGVTTLGLWLRGPIILNHGALERRAGEWTEARVDRRQITRYVEETFKPNLRELLDIHRRNGEIAIFVSQTANPLFVEREHGTVFVASPDIVRWAPALYEINAVTGAVCRESPENCRFIDLAEKMSLEPADFYDLVHNTPIGARKIGDFLAHEFGFIRP
jgi:hypothetical protein